MEAENLYPLQASDTYEQRKGCLKQTKVFWFFFSKKNRFLP